MTLKKNHFVKWMQFLMDAPLSPWLLRPAAHISHTEDTDDRSKPPGEDSDHDVNMAMHANPQMNGCDPTCGSNNMFEAER